MLHECISNLFIYNNINNNINNSDGNNNNY